MTEMEREAYAVAEAFKGLAENASTNLGAMGEVRSVMHDNLAALASIVERLVIRFENQDQ